MKFFPTLKTTLLGAICISATACSHLGTKGNTSPAVTTAYLTDSVQRRLSDMDIVVVGENHDNAIHHEIQLEVIQRLHHEGRLGQVIFEHLNEQQAADFNQTTGCNPSKECAKAELNTLLQWQESHWPDFEMFYPIFVFLKDNNISVVAGHVDRKALMSLYQGKSPELISQENRQKIPLDKALPPDAEKALVERIRDSHCGMLNDEHAKAMLPLQRYRDGYMAAQYLAHQHNTNAINKTTVYLLGNGHAREDYGVPYYLRSAMPTLKIHVIQLEEADSADYEILQKTASGSYFEHVIATPTQERDDPCKDADKQFEKTSQNQERK